MHLLYIQKLVVNKGLYIMYVEAKLVELLQFCMSFVFTVTPSIHKVYCKLNIIFKYRIKNINMSSFLFSL